MGTSRTASTVAIVKCATSVTRTATKTNAKTATKTQTADPPTTIPTTSALEGTTDGTPTCSTVQSTGTAARRREPTSSVPPDLSTNQTRCSATGQTGSTVEADPLVIRVMKTANKVMRFSTLCFLNIF